jgi:protein-tyrosine phosphatase
MIKIAFVCHGNICRSPLAEFVFKDRVAKLKISDKFYVESFGTSGEELYNPVYPPVQAILRKRGISFGNKRAQKLSPSDYEMFDYFLCMEEYNKKNALRIFGGDDKGKVFRFLDFTKEGGDVADPYYYGGFEKVESDIDRGVDALIKFFMEKTF